MSTSDVTHIQQGFVLEIPRRKRWTEAATAAEALCDEVCRTITGVTRYYDHVCGILRETVDWLTLTTSALARQHNKLIEDTLASLPSDDDIEGRKKKMMRKRKRSKISPVTMYLALVGARTSSITGN